MPRRRIRALGALSVLALAGACRASSEAPPPSSATAPASPVAAVPASALAPAPSSSAAIPNEPAPAPSKPELEPLAAEGEFVSLEVEGFRPAVLSVPVGSTTPRPLVVALHGNFDRPEWQCEVWRAATGGYPFILCPRGVPRGDVPKSMDRWEYAGIPKTERELEAGVAALRASFPGRVVDGPSVYVGFSLGAILGVPIVKKAPARYPRLLLIEGGQGALDPHGSKVFKEGGGERVLIACGQASCTQKAKGLVKRLEKQGLPARLVDGGQIGHTYDGAIAEGVAREWPWLVEGLPGWPDASDAAPGAPAEPE